MIIMALICEYCGHKSNEVKSGSGISETGKRIELHLTDPTDLSRDILKVTYSPPHVTCVTQYIDRLKLLL